MSRRAFLAVRFSILLVPLAMACGQGKPNSDGITIEPARVTPPVTRLAGPTTTPNVGPELTRFTFPIAGACLPKGSQLMPNAPRPYRNGTHEGIDLYDSDNCTRIGRGTPVLATKSGTVLRADVSYKELSADELKQLNLNPGSALAIDRFRGRQVWVDHGGGVVTRYAHLLSVSPGITPGARVDQGQVIAFVGESGTPESVEAPGTDNHLHFELRIGDSFLGQGRTPADVRTLYSALFEPR